MRFANTLIIIIGTGPDQPTMKGCIKLSVKHCDREGQRPQLPNGTTSQDRTALDNKLINPFFVMSSEC